MTTAAERLTAVQDAIDKCIAKGLTSYSISTGNGSRSGTRHTLDELHNLEIYYKGLLVKEQRNGGRGGIRVRRMTY